MRAFKLLLLEYKLCSDSSMLRWPEPAWCFRGGSGAEQRDVLCFDVASRQNQIDSLIEFGDLIIVQLRLAAGEARNNVDGRRRRSQPTL